MNNHDITLSVTVLSYNNSPYIIECLESIAKQGIDSYEVFVIDDSSKDDSVELVREFIKTHPQFELICKENSGGAISSQIGIARSRGKYCAIVDSDDIVADGAYKTLIDRLEKDGTDFAAGMPAKLKRGFMFASLQHTEASLFTSNRVLRNEKEIADFSKQVYYWNSVYRTDFIKDNDIYMPSNLLIADRIFLYKAIMCASSISIDSKVVYYWREKANQKRKSIMDRTSSYSMIADRCISFLAQVRISLEGKARKNSIIWENSLERLFYPLYSFEYTNKNKKNFNDICEIYRQTLMEYPAFFFNMVETAVINARVKIIIVLLFKKKYEELFDFLKAGNVDTYIEKNKPGKDIQKYLFFGIKDIFITEFEKSNEDLYLRYNCRTIDKNCKVESVKAYGRFFEHECIELPVDEVKKTIDISELPIGMYLLRADASGLELDVSDTKVMSYSFGTRRMETSRMLFDTREYIYSYHPSISCIKVLKKNAFTLLKDNDSTYIHINRSADFVKRLYFFNIEGNKIIEMPEETSERTYKIESDALPEGCNILLYETTEGHHDSIDVLSLANSQHQQEAFADMFSRNRIEIIK